MQASNLCHEFYHQLAYQLFRFRDSWHTRGFYERSAALYHYVHGGRRRSGCAGRRCRAGVGGSTGRARIAASEVERG
jgi:hypothetical protein